MAKGIIYCMTTIVEGMVKIGRTGIGNFEQRMYSLERNGYANVAGLKRYFAIEVEDYEAKESLIHEIFSKSRVGDTELFALDVNLVVQLLSSMDGTQVFPKDKPKEVVFDEATENKSFACIPDGEYYFNYKPRGGKEFSAVLKKKEGQLILCKGSKLNTERDDIPVAGWKAVRHSESIVNGVVVKDIPCDSLSMAGALVKGYQTNGWDVWKTKDRKPLDTFRKGVSSKAK